MLPAVGVAGPSASTAILAGKYQFDKTSGPVAGKHEVILQVIRPASMQAEAPAPKQLNPRTDPKVKEHGKATYFPEHRVTVDVPSKSPFQLDLDVP